MSLPNGPLPVDEEKECICDHREDFHRDFGCVMFGCDCDVFVSQRQMKKFLRKGKRPIVPAEIAGSEVSEQIARNRGFDRII